MYTFRGFCGGPPDMFYARNRSPLIKNIVGVYLRNLRKQLKIAPVHEVNG